MSKKLSYSQIRLFCECGHRYKLHYINRQRSKYFHSALAFGSAIDAGLNCLLLEKNVDKSIQEFDKLWSFQLINNTLTNIKTNLDLVYADSDFDHDLLTDEDWQEAGGKESQIEYFRIKAEKKERGYKNLSDNDKELYVLLNWLSTRRKGHVMLQSYNEKVIPHIRKVLAVQHNSILKNDVGDEITQVVDLIVEWEDGSIILFDNKTAGRAYDEEAAQTSQQLISYFYENKEKFNLGAVGFIVLNKHIVKNKEKYCTKCKKLSDSNRVKTCAFEYEGKRCGGEFEEKLRPECAIQILTSTVSEPAIDLVLSTFDEANHGIKNQIFYKNLLACKNGSIICPYFGLCWHGDKGDLIELPEREEK